MAKLLQPLFIPTPVELAVHLKDSLKYLASDAAMLVQQIHYWISQGAGEVVDGVRWVYNSYQEWCAQFPWLSEYAFRKIRNRLVDEGIIKVEQLGLRQEGRDRTCWYTVNYDHEWLQNSTDGSVTDSTDASVESSTDDIDPETFPENTSNTQSQEVLEKCLQRFRYKSDSPI